MICLNWLLSVVRVPILLTSCKTEGAYYEHPYAHKAPPALNIYFSKDAISQSVIVIIHIV